MPAKKQKSESAAYKVVFGRKLDQERVYEGKDAKKVAEGFAAKREKLYGESPKVVKVSGSTEEDDEE